MDISRELRLELNALSKEVFGVSSKWRHILEKGRVELVTKKVIETVPGKEGEEPTTKETTVPVLTASGGKQSVIKRYTLEEVHEILLGAKKQRDEIMAQIKKQQEDKAAAEAEQKALQHVHETAHGSAV